MPNLNTILVATAALLVMACDKHEQFALDQAQVSCELYDDCDVLEIMGEFETIDSCTDALVGAYGPEGESCIQFDPSNSEECLEGILLMTCDDLYTGFWPAACDAACP